MRNSQPYSDGQTPPRDDDGISDALLIEGVQQRSELALTALFERYGGMALSLAQSIVGEHARAENVVLDVFMRCWDGDATFDSERGPLQTWLLNLTRQQASETLAAGPPGSPNDGAEQTGRAGPAPATLRPLRERLLARARGEDAPPAAAASGLTAPADATPGLHDDSRPAPPPPGPTADPFPAPPGPIPVPVQVVEPPPPPRRATLEPIPSTRVPPRPRQRRIRLASLGWGVALLFVIAAGLFVWAWSVTGPHASPMAEARARLPGGQVRTLSGATLRTAKARLFVYDNGAQAELAVDQLPAPPAGRVYQIWFAEPGQPFKSGGTFTVDARGDTVTPVTIPTPLERVRGISITEEPAGGSANPSGAELLSWLP